MPNSIIITAAGKGLRMQSDLPKQFLIVNGKPILFYTIEKFFQYDPSIQIILVLPTNQIDYWNTLIDTYNFEIPHEIVAGGETRYHSIKNGLFKSKGKIIGVHDGVRPLVSIEVIKNCFDSAKINGATIPVIPIHESVREFNKLTSISVNRDNYKKVQTPQCFINSIIQSAYDKPYSPLFTDDASVVEANGVKISVIEGNDENIKITKPFDLKLAEILLR